MRTRMQKEARGERLHGALGQGGGALTGLEAQHPSAGWLKGSAQSGKPSNALVEVSWKFWFGWFRWTECFVRLNT